MPKIYCFINRRPMRDWNEVMAIAEDGTYLAGHISSTEGWARHDIGIGSDWKHDTYRKHYPEGYELVWLDKPKGHVGLKEAYDRNQAMKLEKTT